MTAEVAILNKSAVAIASDSAVTVELLDSSGRIHDKIYNTANKLFSLSKHAPVGIMVYNTMELGGVPWESIIKEFRRHLGETRYDSLQEYADEFFAFLCDNSILFPDSRIKDVLLQILIRFFSSIGNRVNTNKDATALLNKKIIELDKLDFANSFDESHQRLTGDYLQLIDKAAETIFSGTLLRNNKTKCRRLAILAITKVNQLSGFSGIVITGFGEKEAFPTLVEYRADLIIFGKVRKHKIQEYTPDQIDAGKVLSFAQQDITKTILEGINPGYAKQMMISIIEFMGALPKTIIDSITELSPKRKTHYKSTAMNATIQALEEFFKRMENERREKHTFQIEKSIQMMPFSELAEIAELFINLTQVRRRLSPDSETVGGPIDVAVISKADGFVWIKRKFYFDKELNYSFFKGYLDSPSPTD